MRRDPAFKAACDRLPTMGEDLVSQPTSTPEVHQWCASQEPIIFYLLGQSGNAVLKRKVPGLLDQALLLYRYKLIFVETIRAHGDEMTKQQS